MNESHLHTKWIAYFNLNNFDIICMAYQQYIVINNTCIFINELFSELFIIYFVGSNVQEQNTPLSVVK